MKKLIFIVIILGMFAWAVYDFASSTDNTAETSKNEATASEGQGEASGDVDKTDTVGLNIGDTAPDFQLTTLNGEKVKLSDYRGGPVMLNFWATWCPPCRAEMPDMEKFHQNKDVTILAVNLTKTESGIGDVTDFVNEFDLTFPILMDEQVEVAATYQIQPIPTTYMIDPDGVIRFRAFGAMNYELMVQELEKMY
ncbi:TlpA family protein disulfide reductase [Virgibacillus doumboii]|uniref:TlpA family protein disulfide reductase n=1 Tax=Virgibacillus doumboii TaxID=2697503 RepID=UPI0013E09CC5|nr:redoxin domain-containing protein [Virgibacillus doumboii]